MEKITMGIKPLIRIVVGLELVLLGLLHSSVLGQTTIFMGGIILIAGLYHWNKNKKSSKSTIKKVSTKKKSKKRR